MYIKEIELDALNEACDFIENRIDGAEDQEYYQNMLSCIHSLLRKANKEYSSQLFRKKVKAQVKLLIKNK